MPTRQDEKVWRDEETLRWAYHEKGLSTKWVGKLLGVHDSTILKWMDEHNIDRNSSDTSPDDGFDCPSCNKTFDTDRGLKVHHKQKHGESIADRPANERGSKKGAEHECPSCSKSFDSKLGMKSHHAKAHGDPLRPQHECEECGDIFETKPHRNPTYCSYECKYKNAPSGRENGNWKQYKTVTCERCSDDFDVRPSVADRRRFCSMECRRNQVTIECAHCGDEYNIKACAADGSRFCSRECYHEWMKTGMVGPNNPRWKGGVLPYGEGWSKNKKRRVRMRDQARCQHCGRTEPEHLAEFGTKHVVHHIRPARSFDNSEKRNAMENLITLCRGDCHRTWEQMSPLRPLSESA